MKVRKMNVKSHFILLVYPFRHAISGKGRIDRLRKLNGRWLHWWRRLDGDERKRFLDDTYFFLPYIRELLFPETAHLPVGDIEQQAKEAERIAMMTLEHLAKISHPDGVLRLTFNSENLEALHPLQVEFELRNAGGKVVEQFFAPFRICWADVVLFPQNVGFLVLKVKLSEDKLTVRRLCDFLYHIRLVHPPIIGWQLANLRRVKREAPITFKSQDLVDFLLQGLTDVATDLDPTIDAFLNRLHKSGSVLRYSETKMGQVYGQVFRLYTYACLDDTEPSSNPEAVGFHLHRLFASPEQQALYELATCTDTTDPNYVPHEEGLRQIMDKGHIAFWENWEGMALHDNVVFLGKRPTKFTLNTLSQNVESDYFHLYLLALYQKIRLSLLSGELLRHAKDLHRNLKEARSLWDAFIMFHNHYWFVEATFRPQGNELYRRFQMGLGVEALFESIGNEVRELQEYYERKSERRISALLNFLTFVGLPASLLVELFSNALIKGASWLQFGLTAAILYAVIGIGWLLWSHLVRE